jgi:hypothetical protein
MVEVFYYKQTEEVIEEKGDPGEVWGLKTAKSFRGFLQGKINYFCKKGDKHNEMILRSILDVYNKFHPETKATVEIEGWKGKSGIVEIMEKPDSVDIVRFRKLDQDSEPKRVVHNIPKRDINIVLNALQRLKVKEIIKSKDIALEYCKMLNLGFNSHGRELFDNNGFIWDNFFSDRRLHNLLVDILDMLDKRGFIQYRHGEVKVLDKRLEFDLNLP